MTNDVERKMLECASTIATICNETPDCEKCPFHIKEEKIGSCCKLQVFFPATWSDIVLDIIDERIKTKRKEIHEITNRQYDEK